MGVYPLLTDDTCYFLAVDFDKAEWQKDVTAFLEICKEKGIPASLERSRSGNGGHVWIFFTEAVPASSARKLGSYILTLAMSRRSGISFDSYDRFFPSQDSMPKGGFGNLIALPLQKKAREKGNSVFLDEYFIPYPDQWNYLSSVKRMSPTDLEPIIHNASSTGDILGVKSVSDEECEEPWNRYPKTKLSICNITEALPSRIQIVLSNQIYIEKENLPPALLNALIRLAAFQNPEFYKAQAMRMPTYNKPRIISCHEDYPKHIGLPIGCLEEVTLLLNDISIIVEVTDNRFSGNPIDVTFSGILETEQKQAAKEMLKYDTGILAATTAFGKTVIAIHMIAVRKVNTLIIVHRKQLLDQWISRLSSFLDIKEREIGIIGGGKRKVTGKIDVAVIQSLSKKGEVDDIVSEYGQIIVDECHHISAFTFEAVVKNSKAKYVLGLSATVTRKDGHHPIVLMNLGPIRYSVDAKKYSNNSSFGHRVIPRLTSVKFEDILTDVSYSFIHKLYNEIITNTERNELIVNDVIDAMNDNRCVLVLTERKEHMKLLYSLLSSKIKNVIALEAGVGKKKRVLIDAELNSIPEDEPRVIISTGKYIGEGFDDARLDTLFLTMPVSWKGIIAQYAGRLHRSHHLKKEVIIYDYVDSNSPVFRKMYAKRVKGYRAIGYEIQEL